MATILGARGTGNLQTDERGQNFMDGILWLTETKRESPLLGLAARIRSEPTDDFTFNHFEMQPPRRTVNSSAGFSATATSLTFDDGSGGGVSNNFIKNTFLTNLRTLETVQVSSDATSNTAAVTVVRGYGSVAGAVINNGDEWAIGTSASEDKSVVPTMVSVDPSKVQDFTQTIRKAIDISRRLAKTHLRDMPAYEKLKREQLIILLGQLEGAGIWGKKQDAAGAASGQRLTTTGGFIEFIVSNIKNFTGVVQDSTLLAQIEIVMRFSKSGEKLVLAGGAALTTFERLAKLTGNPLVHLEPNRTFGLPVKTWTTGHGDLHLFNHPLLSRTTTMADWALVVDPQFLAYRYFGDEDIELLLDRNVNGQDGFTDEWLVDAGYQKGLENTHALWEKMTVAQI